MSCKMKDICSGELRHAVIIERPDRSADGSGGYTNSVWNIYATVFCMVEDRSGQEKFDHHRIETRKLTVFTCRYRPDIRETDRINFEGRYYNIRRIDDLERRKRWLEITAEAGVVD